MSTPSGSSAQGEGMLLSLSISLPLTRSIHVETAPTRTDPTLVDP
jgi:hypothetical protein